MENTEIVDTVVSCFIKEKIKDSKYFLKELHDEGKILIGDGLKKYLSEKYSKYNRIRTILKGNTPVEFYSVYYSLGIIKRGNYRSTRSTRSTSRTTSTESIKDVFKDGNCISIIGDAGSGKSTLVKHLFIQSLKRKSLIPIMIELRYIKGGDSSFFKYIENIVVESKITANNRIVERMLNCGKFVFFFDGFDEISSEYESEIIKGIDDFTSRYHNNRYILTTRPNSTGESIPNFINYNIAPLSVRRGDIDAFVDLQLKDERELADKIKSSLSGGVAEYIHSFLSNPLLLSLYILTYQSNAEIPDKKYIFYRRVINSLYSEHDSKSKLGYVREKRTKLNQVELEKVLKAFCFLSYFEGMYSFDYDYVVSVIGVIKRSVTDCKFGVSDFICDMKVSFSLWVDDSGIFSFAHRSLQEYFCALFIKDLVDTNKASVYKKLLLHCAKARNLTETKNLLSLCEEMDTVYFYEYYHLPLSQELYDHLNRGDIKNQLKNFILFFCRGCKVHSSAFKKVRKRMFSIMVNREVYKSVYIHIDHTKALHDALSHVFDDKCSQYFKFDKDVTVLFCENEEFFEYVVEALIEDFGTRIITDFMQYLENEIKAKTKYIENTLKTDVDLINMI